MKFSYLFLHLTPAEYGKYLADVLKKNNVPGFEKISLANCKWNTATKK